MKSLGHSVRQVAIGVMSDDFMEFPSTVMMGRIYPEWSKPLELMKTYQKQGKKVIYDMDDDFWLVDPSNPSRKVSGVFKDQFESLIRQADALTTPSPILAKKMRKLTKKPIYICNNTIDTNDYKLRPKTHEGLIIGYMGASSHWKDLQIIVEPLEKLAEKYDFTFVIYGMMGAPMESEMHEYARVLQLGLKPEETAYLTEALAFYDKLKNLKMMHIPFYTPELHPTILARADFDIGLAPLQDAEFNRAKSNIKFYEYAAVGTPCLSSDVLPYKTEVSYRAKNNFKDWYNKIEKLIVDEKFRNELAEKQREWVMNHRTTKQGGLEFEKACQREGGLEILSQRGLNNEFK